MPYHPAAKVIHLEAEITYHNTDIVMKAACRIFQQDALKFLGLDLPSIIDLAPTEMPVLEAKETRTDFIFQLADGSLLHLEFQTTASLDDLYRFLLYDARLVYHTRKIIRTVVIYAGEINQAADTLLKGTVDYQVRNVYLHNYDGDAVYQWLLQKAEKGEPFTRREMPELIFLPLMKSSADRSVMAIQDQRDTVSTGSNHSHQRQIHGGKRQEKTFGGAQDDQD